MIAGEEIAVARTVVTFGCRQIHISRLDGLRQLLLNIRALRSFESAIISHPIGEFGHVEWLLSLRRLLHRLLVSLDRGRTLRAKLFIVEHVAVLGRVTTMLVGAPVVCLRRSHHLIQITIHFLPIVPGPATTKLIHVCKLDRTACCVPGSILRRMLTLGKAHRTGLLLV